MSRYAIDEPDLDRYDEKPFDVHDEPRDGEPYDAPMDPAEHAAHALIDAVSTMEAQLAQVTDLDRARVLKALIHRAWASLDRLDLHASSVIDALVERRR